MKLLGFDIQRQRNSDQVVVRNIVPNQTPISKIPNVKPAALNYGQSFSFGRGMWRAGEYDLSEIGKIEDTDGYVARSFNKKLGLMFKEGYGFSGPNKVTVRYLKTRLAQIARASNIPTEDLLKRTASSLIRVSNAFWIKVRDPKASGGKSRTTPEDKELKPVAAYFPAAPETMRYELDPKSGKIVRWRQMMPDGTTWKEFRPDEVVHFCINRREGFIFGVPTLIPVIDDIRALRQIEENVELLLYQYLFPLFHYKVGTESAPAGYTEDGEREIDVVRTQIQYMPSEGALVTPERHEITAIGAEGRALRAEGYIEHFKKRVFAGLGVSQVDMGDGDCYDIHTQTLTESGWKYHWEIDHTQEKIATYNPETQQIEFHKANYKYEGKYVGDMLTFSGKHIDIKISPRHEMWVKPRVKPGHESSFEKVRAIDIWENKYYQEFYMLESASFADNPDIIDCVQVGSAAYPTDLFAGFLGYFISEGCLDRYQAEQNRYNIRLSQNAGPVLDDMCGLLDALHIPYSLSFTRENQGTIQAYGKDLYEWIDARVGQGSHAKCLPEEVYGWSRSARSKLLDALVSGDGTVSSLSGRTSKTYYTTSESLADGVQRLALSIGFAAKVKLTKQSKDSHNPDGSIYRVHISGDGTGPVLRLVSRDMMAIKHYEDTIYCYNVENHLFVTRRNGKVTIQGNTTNRATAQTMSRALIDTVKSTQDSFESQFNHLVIHELLLESTFGDQVLEDENLVQLQFKEIDIQNKMEQEEHLLKMFEGNGITWDELRAAMGLEPIPVPEDPEDQDPSKYPEWFNTNWKLFKEPENLIRAVDEPYSVAAKQAAEARSMGTTSQQISKSAEEKSQEVAKAAEEDRKTKMALAQAKPRVAAKDNVIESSFKLLESDTVERIQTNLMTRGHINEDVLRSYARNWAEDTASRVKALASLELISGINHETGFRANEALEIISIARQQLSHRIDFFVQKLAMDAISLVKRRVDSLPANDKLANKSQDVVREVRTAFEAVRFRTRFIWDVEIRKAYNYGRVIGMRLNGAEFLTLNAAPGACEACQASNGRLLNLASIDLDDVPPLHPNSRMAIRALEDAFKAIPKKEKGKEAMKQDDPSLEKHTATCPECGHSAVLQRKTGAYYCQRCNMGYSKTEVGKDEDIQDAPDKMERCVLSVKQQLRKKNPGWSEARVKSGAYAICTAQLKSKKG